MVKKLIIVVVGFFISTSAFGAKVVEPALLQDGFVLRGIDGQVNGPDSNDGWFFRFDVDVNDDKGVVKAGTSLELLPAATLEKIIADVNERSSTNYRLWGRVTKYKGRNFIFVSYFLALSKIERPQPQVPQAQETSGQESKPAEFPSAKEREPERDVNEPNDILSIPQEIIEKLRARRAVQPAIRGPGEVNDVNEQSGVVEGRETEPEPGKRPELKQDSILADRTALLGRRDDGRLVFVLDALGLNAPQASLQLLPCEAMELTEQEQSALAEPAPFKIAGIMTKYKGRYYLLLQKATRVYGYGNFGG